MLRTVSGQAAVGVTDVRFVKRRLDVVTS